MSSAVASRRSLSNPRSPSDSTDCLALCCTSVKEPWSRAAGRLYPRLQQMFKTGTSCLKRWFPVLLLVVLTEGQTVQVTGTDLTITVRSVEDFTSEGCLRGPTGCFDNVQLEITRSNLSQQIALAAPHTELQSAQRVNRANVFGHEITLVSLKNKQVVLNVNK